MESEPFNITETKSVKIVVNKEDEEKIKNSFDLDDIQSEKESIVIIKIIICYI